MSENKTWKILYINYETGKDISETTEPNPDFKIFNTVIFLNNKYYRVSEITTFPQKREAIIKVVLEQRVTLLRNKDRSFILLVLLKSA